MTYNVRARWLVPAILLTVVFQPHASRAELLQFTYTGEVTSVENDGGFFTAAAAVGAPVSGSFMYTDPPSDGSEEFSPFTTFYFNDRSVSAATELVVRIGGVEAKSQAFSLTNLAVGNDNEDPLPPYFPAGDFYRYVDELDGGSPLFDFNGASLAQFPFGNIILGDSTGTAFVSQFLPHDLPTDAFDQRNGILLISDENSEFTGRLEFRIDSIQKVPEPSALVLMLTGLLAGSSIASMCRLDANLR